jgi:DNA-binding Lrp family transcriptional regulator
MKKTSPTPPDRDASNSTAVPDEAGVMDAPYKERDATAAEMRALAHGLRWRILRITLNKSMTNKQIAERLGRDPGTTLYHVKLLVREGFLAAEKVRAGNRGAHEIPYRATGKSWRIRLKPDAGNAAAILDAVREEVAEMGDDAAVTTVRLGVRLKPDDLAELKRRIVAIGAEFEPLDDPDSEPIGILAIVHRRRP